MAGIPQVITEDRASGAQFIGGSLKFDSSKHQYLKRTPTSEGNRKLWTWSGWLKRTPGALHDIFSAGQEVTNDGLYSRFRIDSDDCLNYRQWVTTSSLDAYLVSSMKLRDPSAYFHYVVIYDSNNSTNSDKVRFYINGQRVTVFSSNDYPGGTNGSWVNSSSKTHTIGGHYDGGGTNADSFWNGHMSQVYFLDGQALGPEYFGFTDPLTGTWRPKKYEGDFKIIPDNQLLYNVNTGDNGFDSGTSSRTYDATGRTFTTYSAPQTANPGGFGANSAHVYKSPDGAAIDWVISTDSTDRYVWTSTDGINWTNTGVQDTDGSVVTVNTAWLAIAGGSNSTNATVTSSTAGYGLVAGRNSFYLPMDGNSPIGEDKSGIVTPNNGSIWSTSLTSSSGFRSSEPKENAFDGSTSSICSAVGSGTVTFTSPVKFASNSTIRVFLHGGDHTVTVNGGSNQTISAGSFQTVTYSNSGNSTFVMTFHRGGGSDTGVRAIEIDGVILTDGLKGNSWTPVNFSGSVELPKATGAIPILKTNGGGTVARSGVRTDKKTYTVTASGGNYYLDGVLKPTLNAYRGGSYTFDYTGATSHPFYLSSLPDGKHNSKAYSVGFDGTGDYLGVTGNSDYDFGTGDFTIEGYFYTTNNNGTIASSQNYYSGGSNGNWLIRISTATQIAFASYDGSGNEEYTEFTAGYQTNTWHHFAFVRSGTTLTFYLDGSPIGTMTVNKSLSDGSNGILIGEDSANLNPEFNGKISNFRINKGTALYTAAFEPPNTTLTNVTGTTLLCCQDSNATTGAVLPSGSTITANGNAAASNTSPFLYDNNGYYGVNTGTSNTTKITIPHTAADTLYYYCNVHSGMGSSINVTTDVLKADPYAWKCVLALPLLESKDDVSASINVNSTTKTTAITGNSEPRSDRWDLYSGAFYFDSTADYIEVTPTAGTTLADNTVSYTIEFFFSMNNGRLTDNTYNIMWSTSSGLTIAKWRSGISNKVYFESDGNATGWNITGQEDIDSIRWYHFAAVRNGNTITTYLDGVRQGTKTATYSASAETWWRVGGQNANSSCHAGYMQDFRIYNGVAKYTEDFSRVSTTPDVLPDTPSGITGKSKLTKITEGAMSFDGTGDYLTVDGPGTLAASSNWCMECFFYCTGNSGGTYRIMSANESAQSSEYILMRIRLGQYQFSTDTANSGTINTAAFDKWTHMAFTKEGTTVRGFVDGKKIWETTDSNTVTITNLITGWGYGGEYFPGYISNARFVNGSSVYTADFTPPTAPLTNITNTHLLCCQSPTSANAVAVAPGTFINDGTNYSSGSQVTGSSGLRFVDSLFDGLLNESGASAGEGATVDISSDNYILWTPTTGIPYTSKVEVYCYAANGYEITNYYTFNGGTETTFTGGASNFNGMAWIPVATGSGTINSIKIRITRGSGNQTSVSWYAVKVDGTILINDYNGKSLARFGDAAATNFNPFTDDINAIRGQETGYATWNPLSTKGVVTTSGGNLVADTVENGNGWALSTIPMTSGKYYCEMTFEGEMSHNTNFNYIGIVPTDIAQTYTGLDIFRGLGALAIESNSSKVRASIGTGSGATQSDWNTSIGYDESSTIGIAIDCDAPLVKFYVDGKDVGTYPYTMAANKSWVVFCNDWASGYQDFEKYILNAGQKPFRFTPPDGFQPMNLSTVQPEKVIARPDQYFGVSLWTGNGTSQDITGLLHKPDFVWIKKRAGGTARSHQLFDSVRGVHETLHSNSAGVEDTNTNRLTAFNQDGFSVGGDDGSNGSSGTFVGWTWKAGGNKNTFNIDDVGYANASDVNMSVGALNSVVYNQSQVWSNSSSDPNSVKQSGAATELFNGNLSSGGIILSQRSTSNTAYYVALDGVSISCSNSVACWMANGASTATMRINGDDNLKVAATSTTLSWVTLNFTGTITKIELGYLDGSGSSNTYYGIQVDGKTLIDQGVAVTNVPSIAPTGCSVNTKSKFGIYTYTGSGSGTRTLSHGLEGTPGLVIYKKRNSSSSWQVYHQSLGGTVYNTLDEDVGDYTSDSTRFGGTNPTSSIITLGTHGNGADDTIMYAWCDVPGLQKFGKWTGINNTDGTFVELGFRPALVIAKESSATGSGAQWFMLDSSRNTYNPLNNILDANRENAERQGVIYDFLSNGFKIRTTFNSGATFIYMAWAEAPRINLYGGQSNAR